MCVGAGSDGLLRWSFARTSQPFWRLSAPERGSGTKKLGERAVT